MKDWATSTGLHVDYRSGARDYLLASGTVAQVERLTHTTIGAYRYQGESFIANDAPPRIPSDLPVSRSSASTRTSASTRMQAPGATPNVGSVTPQQLWNIYKQPPEHAGQGVSVAILGEGATDKVIADLHTFDKNNKFNELPVDGRPHAEQRQVRRRERQRRVEHRHAGRARHGAGDLKEVLYFAPSLADTDLVGSTATWVNDPSGPPIMNASLGECEVSPAQPDAQQRRLLPDQRQREPGRDAGQPGPQQLVRARPGDAAAAGGDRGAHVLRLQRRRRIDCAALYPALNGVLNEGVPLTEDPADQPFTVGVGGTVLYTDGTSPANRFLEYAWTHSGGNASPFITAPDYQKGVPNLDRTCVSDPSGNTTNTGQLCRGVPDVAAISGDVISNGYTIVSDGQESTGGGTSLSSPLWAGMWARVVGTAPAGTSGYGFANEAIYKIAKDPARYANSFNDVTVGSNGPTARCPATTT